MSDDYPSDEVLAEIEAEPDANRALELVREAWIWYGSASHDLRPEEAAVCGHSLTGSAKYLRLATGGWSGNESLVEALQRNQIACFLWRLSAAGGLYVYEYFDESRTKNSRDH